MPSYRIHSSGHAKVHDLIRYINEIYPENLISVHTNHAELFKKLFRNEKLEVILPIREVPVNLNR
ncbi:MAG: MBL fold metallo-hydrolase RNA specificity domain-containing protein [Promethearchaeota archaeon]